ncbi:unnamed protein product [Hermetia illucens]|uniref:Uncharacterized protein n=1 Tax=Hermetia illucens TaxID=343691 RepID=A0A7R8YTL6_HERIL|nr:lysosomal acid phosphatase-like [Hermetia illucens]CAD7084887.1 unnamed protein product [Hermetia illucens]
MIKAVRYENLLNNQSLGTDSIYVRSSSIERCIVTAESFLDGFLQNADKVAPINIVPPLEDAMLKFPGMPCPKHKLEFIRNVRLDQPDAIELTNYGMFLKYVEYHSGEDIKDLEHLANIGDTLTVERNYGLEIPSWAEDIYDDFTPVLEFTMDRMSSSKWLQIKSGLLLNDIFERFNHFIRPPPYQKQRENVLFYSAHDLNVQSLLVLLGVFDQTRVRADYGAVVALELHQNKSLRDDMEVQIFYFRDFGDEDPINVRIPSCPAPCAYSKFKDLMKSKLVKNYRRACY